MSVEGVIPDERLDVSASTSFRLDSRSVVLAGTTLLVAYLALVQVVTMLYASFHVGFLSNDAHWSLTNFQHALTNLTFWRLLGNSVLWRFGVIGSGHRLWASRCAFIIIRTNAPFRELWGGNRSSSR